MTWPPGYPYANPWSVPPQALSADESAARGTRTCAAPRLLSLYNPRDTSIAVRWSSEHVIIRPLLDPAVRGLKLAQGLKTIDYLRVKGIFNCLNSPLVLATFIAAIMLATEAI